MSNNQLSWRCINTPQDLGVTLMPDNPAHAPNHVLIPCAYLCANTRDSFGSACQRVNLSWHHKPPWLILLNWLVWSGGTSRDWSHVSCMSVQHFTASCLPASPARLWILVWQGVAAYQTGQAQLLLCCVPMKYILWGLLLNIRSTLWRFTMRQLNRRLLTIYLSWWWKSSDIFNPNGL